MNTIPTIGFNIETLKYKNVSFDLWDLGGGDKLRPLFVHYYENMTGLIYVIDSSDLERLKQSKEELYL